MPSFMTGLFLATSTANSYRSFLSIFSHFLFIYKKVSREVTALSLSFSQFANYIGTVFKYPIDSFFNFQLVFCSGLPVNSGEVGSVDNEGAADSYSLNVAVFDFAQDMGAAYPHEFGCFSYGQHLFFCRIHMCNYVSIETL